MISERQQRERERLARDLERRKQSLAKRVQWNPGKTTGQLHRSISKMAVGQESTEKLLRELAEEKVICEVRGTWWPYGKQPNAVDAAPTTGEPDLVDLVLVAIREEPDGLSMRQLMQETGGTSYRVGKAVRELRDQGLVVKGGTSTGAGRPSQLFVAAPPREPLPPRDAPAEDVGELVQALAEAQTKVMAVAGSHAFWLGPMFDLMVLMLGKNDEASA